MHFKEILFYSSICKTSEANEPHQLVVKRQDCAVDGTVCQFQSKQMDLISGFSSGISCLYKLEAEKLLESICVCMGFFLFVFDFGFFWLCVLFFFLVILVPFTSKSNKLPVRVLQDKESEAQASFSLLPGS